MEPNLEYWPVFRLGGHKRTERPSEGIVVERTLLEPLGGRSLQRWGATMPSAHGPTEAFDQDVYVALMALWHLRGGPKGESAKKGLLRFTVHEVQDILGIGHGGEQHRMVRRSLTRIMHTTVTSQLSFFSKESERYIDDGFSILSRRFDDWVDRRQGVLQERHLVRFNEPFLSSYRLGAAPQLHFGFYLDLARPTAKRLYRYLNQVCEPGRNHEISVLELRDMMPLSSRYSQPSRVVGKLADAHEELLAGGFLEEVCQEGRGSEAAVVYRRAGGFLDRLEEAELLATVALTPGGPEALESLAGVKGISRTGAAQLVVRHGPEACRYYQAQAAKRKGRLGSEAAFIRWGLKEGADLGPLEPAGSAGPRPTGAALVGGSAPAGGDHAKGTTLDGCSGGSMPERKPNPEAERVWALVLDDLAEEIDAPSWRVWFEGTVPRSLEGDVLTVSVPNSFALEYISDRFRDGLEEALRARLSHRADIRIVVDGARTEPSRGPGEGERRAPPLDLAKEPTTPRGDPWAAPVPDDPGETWRELVDQLLEDRPEVKASWFAPYLEHSLEGGELVVSAPDEDALSRIIERFGDDFDRLWKRRRGADARIVVGLRVATAEGGETAEEPRAERPASDSHHRRSGPRGPRPRGVRPA